jgi:hypothetical protein
MGSLRVILPLWILGSVLICLARLQHPALAALMRVILYGNYLELFDRYTLN